MKCVYYQMNQSAQVHVEIDVSMWYLHAAFKIVVIWITMK